MIPTEQLPGFDWDNCKISEIRAQMKKRWVVHSGPRQVNKEGLLEELRGLVRAESFAKPDPGPERCTLWPLYTHQVPWGAIVSSTYPSRWNPDAGFVDKALLARGPQGFALCRFCGEECPSKRRTFCSSGCIHQHKLRTNGSYVRKSLFVRDGGKCAGCGFHAHDLFKKAKAAWESGTTPGERQALVEAAVAGTPWEGKVIP
ncbi:unnamed protein product [Choristocarpus tenellus]